uniref:Uncharacterized protein n=1 Tax=Arundo donax TaxID=35708 RepID=A0A0A8ZS28_ARUDO
MPQQSLLQNQEA